jgi:hypothetical protein
VKLKINPADLGEPATFKWLASGSKVMKSEALHENYEKFNTSQKENDST